MISCFAVFIATSAPVFGPLGLPIRGYILGMGPRYKFNIFPVLVLCAVTFFVLYSNVSSFYSQLLSQMGAFAVYSDWYTESKQSFTSFASVILSASFPVVPIFALAQGLKSCIGTPLLPISYLEEHQLREIYFRCNLLLGISVPLVIVITCLELFSGLYSVGRALSGLYPLAIFLPRYVPWAAYSPSDPFSRLFVVIFLASTILGASNYVAAS